jgi:hypothetical protein
MAKNKHSIKRTVKDNYRLTPIREISARNELPLSEVREAYRKCRFLVLKETIQNIIKGKININYFNLTDKVFSLTEQYLDNKRIKEIDEQERQEKLNDFSVEKGLSYSDVKGIYSKFNSRLFSNIKSNKLEEFLNYNPQLSENAFELTKKYFGIRKYDKSILK